MPSRLSALIAAIGSTGHAPERVRILLAIAGVITLGVTVAVFARHAWTATLDDVLMAWTAMFIVLGLAMIWTAGRK